MPAMMHILARIMVITMLLAAPASITAQQPPENPGLQQPGIPPVAVPGTDRNTGFDHVVAFAGAALTLLVVCYPSRRY